MNVQKWIATCAAVLAFGCGDDDSKSSTNNTANNSANNTANNTANNSANNTANNTNVACDDTFDTASACGGNPEGVWTVADACLNTDDLEIPDCPTATITVEAISSSGTLTVTASNWAYSAAGTVSLRANVPEACAQLAGGCTGVAAVLDASCTDNNGACDCTATVDLANSSSGSYTVSGGIATLDNGERWAFCVEGNSITLREDLDPGDDALNPVYVGTR